MFKKILGISTDLVNLNVPVLDEPPNQSVQMKSQYSPEQSFNGYESRIMASTTALYKNFINWDKIYIIKFPTSYSAFPAVVTRNDEICINMDVSTAKFNLKTNTISADDPGDLSASVLFGINSLLISKLTDDNTMGIFVMGMVNYIYSLICRVYTREIDFSKISNQDIANMYYCVAKLVLTRYVSIYGQNIDGIAKVLTRAFFTGDAVSKVPYKQEDLPEIEIDTYNTLFEYLDSSNILPSVSVGDFRTQVNQTLSLTALLCLSNGVSLCSMLLTCRLPSNVFNDRVIKVNPKVSNTMFSAMLNYLTKQSKIVAKGPSKPPTDWGWEYD